MFSKLTRGIKDPSDRIPWESGNGAATQGTWWRLRGYTYALTCFLSVKIFPPFKPQIPMCTRMLKIQQPSYPGKSCWQLLGCSRASFSQLLIVGLLTPQILGSSEYNPISFHVITWLIHMVHAAALHRPATMKQTGVSLLWSGVVPYMAR